MAAATRKVYFIHAASDDASRSGRWTHTLKQTYKSADAVRDIIDWANQAREFYVCLKARRGDRRRTVFHINPPGSPSVRTDFATKRPVVGAIDLILSWTREGTDFDITMLERKRREVSGLERLGRARN